MMARRSVSHAAWLAACLIALPAGRHSARADALTPALDPLSATNNGSVPPAKTAPPAPGGGGPRCTIASIVEDIGTNDAYLSRTRFLAPEAPAAGQPAICPAGAAQEAARRTLEACKKHASNSYNCVYGDMNHMFGITTDIVDTSAVDAQCPSYTSKFIAIACQPGLAEDVCNVGCGGTAVEATQAAQTKCKANHDGDCGVTNAVPVQAP
jgi:hypothetical protein